MPAKKVNDFGGDLIKTKRGAKNPMVTLKRLLKYTFSNYKVATVFVIIGVIISASASAIGSALLAPIIAMLTPDETTGTITATMSDIVPYVVAIGCVYLLGAACSFMYNRIMM